LRERGTHRLVSVLRTPSLARPRPPKAAERQCCEIGLVTGALVPFDTKSLIELGGRPICVPAGIFRRNEVGGWLARLASSGNFHQPSAPLCKELLLTELDLDRHSLRSCT
jgi:hypothetical protein